MQSFIDFIVLNLACVASLSWCVCRISVYTVCVREIWRYLETNVLQCVAVCCRVLPCVAVCCNVLSKRDMKVRRGERVAVCCNVLQCVAISSPQYRRGDHSDIEANILTLHRVCTCRRAHVYVQHTATHCTATHCHTLQHTYIVCAVCCSVLQCVREGTSRRVCCSVLQCVAVCCYHVATIL